MQNIDTLHSIQLPINLPTAPQLPVITTNPTPQLHTIHRSDTTTLTLTSYPLPPNPISLTSQSVSISQSPPTTSTPVVTTTTSSSNNNNNNNNNNSNNNTHVHHHDCHSITIHTSEPTTPTSLIAMHYKTDDTLLLTLRSGEVYIIKPSIQSIVLLADVKDEHDPSKSGVLTASLSYDGLIISIISPISIILLNSQDFSTIHEFKFPVPIIHACICWKIDNQYVCILLRSKNNDILSYVIDKQFDNMIQLDTKPSSTNNNNENLNNLAIVMDWEPRIGGFISISGPNNQITFFEANGERHKRKDFQIVSNQMPAKILKWSPNCKLLAIVNEEHEDQGQGDGWRLGLYLQSNYKWYCKKRVSFQHRIITIHWDLHHPGILYVITEHEVFRFHIHQSSLSTIISNPVASTCISTVVNADQIILTDFTHSIVPPPLAHTIFTCHEDITAVCPIRNGHGLGALTVNGIFEWVLFDFDLFSGQRGTEWFNGCRASMNPSELNKCRRFKKKLFIQSLSNSDEDNEDMSYNNGGALYMRMPVMSSQTCVVIVAPETLWKDNKTGCPNDSLFMFVLNDSSLDHISNDNNNRNNNGLYPHGENSFSVKESCRMLIDGGRVCAIGQSNEDMSIVLVTSQGVLMRIIVDEYSGKFLQIAKVNNIQTNIIRIEEITTKRGRALTIILSDDGKLEVLEIVSRRKVIVSHECTSYCVHEGFLNYTIKSNLLYCILLDTKSSLSNNINKFSIPSVIDLLDSQEQFPSIDLSNNHGIIRPIDRNSLIITPLLNKTGIILQAPRGNLETISPRPIVYEVVSKLTKNNEYFKAFELCRKQRVDMNHVINNDFVGFIENIKEFVSQIKDPNHLSIFMTFLNGEQHQINQVCQAIVNQLIELQKENNLDNNNVNYISAILTGMIKHKPSNFEGALQQIEILRKNNQITEAGSAVDFLFVLVKDESKVYKEALGLYDLELSGFIAECSQLDPQEYIKELHDFRNLQGSERKYKIDMKLERYDKALKHLFACGERRHTECVRLCHEHHLYEIGLSLFRNNQTIRLDLLNGYGEYLKNDVQRYHEASVIFLQLNDWKKVIECYKLQNKWEMAIYSTNQCKQLTNEEKHDLFVSIADDLADSGLSIQCARIRANIIGDIEGALEVICSAEEWDTAFEIINVNLKNNEDMNNRKQILKKLILEGYEILLSTLRENHGKLKERGDRYIHLSEMHMKFKEGMKSTTNKDEDHENESDVFSATSASSIGSNLSDVTFTAKTHSASTSVYSTSNTAAGPLTSAKLEKQAQKRKQRASKKRIREGHPNEREYLVGYLKKLLPTQFIRDRVCKMTNALLLIGSPDLAVTLIGELDKLVNQAMSLPIDIVDEKFRAELQNDTKWSAPATTLKLACNTDSMQDE